MITETFFKLIARDVEVPDHDLDHLEQSIQGRSLIAARTDVFRAGPSTFLHLLRGGWACKYKLLSDGRRQITSFHLAGEILDLDRINRTNLPFAVLALSRCSVARISLEEIRQAIDQRPAVRNLFWSLATDENLNLMEQIVSLGRRSARERVACFFYYLLKRLEAVGEARDGEFASNVSQNEIADALGLSTVHLNRTLQELKSDGVLASRGRTYRVLDSPLLKAVAMIEG